MKRTLCRLLMKCNNPALFIASIFIYFFVALFIHLTNIYIISGFGDIWIVNAFLDNKSWLTPFFVPAIFGVAVLATKRCQDLGVNSSDTIPN